MWGGRLPSLTRSLRRSTTPMVRFWPMGPGIRDLDAALQQEMILCTPAAMPQRPLAGAAHLAVALAVPACAPIDAWPR